MIGEPQSTTGRRIVAFSNRPAALGLITDWVARNGHRPLLVVTTPGPSTRRSTTYRDVVALSPPGLDVFVTTRVRRAIPLIAALAPDLIVSASFPYRIPPEIVAIPRHGAINVHPAPLPAYRGPNMARAIYDGAATFGVTVHRTAEDYDTGGILAQEVRPMPAQPSTESVFALLKECAAAALDAGAARAFADEAGESQDEALATYAAPFTDAERWLRWAEPAAVLNRQALALTLMGLDARATIEGGPYAVTALRPVPDAPPDVAPGTVVRRANGTFILRVGDGLVEIEASPAADG
ncbi:MAG: Methionyl-tRNA formyltransferase [uncultured Thermomicrobiales bacterium]|uniref:Methionyl-tRNA formyltransferase n=1 Tax=uncultured Thermomicrobiales bacterium TaxID=1645740 RepID=A0A6J4U923_9BACT|nr:MAG: Methionyl-tRNA formyltransferase [uncultured Thermomicrobiales bacterium]